MPILLKVFTVIGIDTTLETIVLASTKIQKICIGFGNILFIIFKSPA